MSSLDAWGDIIRQQGEEARRLNDERTKQMEVDLPQLLRDIQSFSDAELLNRLVHFHPKRYSYPIVRRQRAIWRLYCMHLRRHILNRMEARHE